MLDAKLAPSPTGDFCSPLSSPLLQPESSSLSLDKLSYSRSSSSLVCLSCSGSKLRDCWCVSLSGAVVAVVEAGAEGDGRCEAEENGTGEEESGDETVEDESEAEDG